LDPHNEDLIRRIHEDLRDDFDEELELELDDRSLEPAADPGPADRESRRLYDLRRRAAIAFSRAHTRPAEAVEAEPDGPRVAPPLGGVHEGQGDHAGAHPHSRGAVVGGHGRPVPETMVVPNAY